MTFALFGRPAPLAAAVLGALFVTLGTPPAAADCRGDLLASQQSLERTRAGVDLADKGADAQRCPAYRRHHAALVQVREVFVRCDTGAQKAERAAQVGTTIESFRARMPRGCKP